MPSPRDGDSRPPNRSTALEALIFDLDGTLAVSDQDASTVLSNAFAAAGVDPFCDVDAVTAAANDVPDADSDRD